MYIGCVGAPLTRQSLRSLYSPSRALPRPWINKVDVFAISILILFFKFLTVIIIINAFINCIKLLHFIPLKINLLVSVACFIYTFIHYQWVCACTCMFVRCVFYHQLSVTLSVCMSQCTCSC